MSVPLLIYVAGPYTAKTAWGIEENIHRARAMGVALAKLGAYPVIPHSNTGGFHGEAPEEMFYAGTLALMERCDGVCMLDTWRQSTGATQEHLRAMMIGMPIYDPTSVLTMTVEEWLLTLRKVDFVRRMQAVA